MDAAADSLRLLRLDELRGECALPQRRTSHDDFRQGCQFRRGHAQWRGYVVAPREAGQADGALRRCCPFRGAVEHLSRTALLSRRQILPTQPRDEGDSGATAQFGCFAENAPGDGTFRALFEHRRDDVGRRVSLTGTGDHAAGTARKHGAAQATRPLEGFARDADARNEHLRHAAAQLSTKCEARIGFGKRVVVGVDLILDAVVLVAADLAGKQHAGGRLRLVCEVRQEPLAERAGHLHAFTGARHGRDDVLRLGSRRGGSFGGHVAQARVERAVLFIELFDLGNVAGSAAEVLFPELRQSAGVERCALQPFVVLAEFSLERLAAVNCSLRAAIDFDHVCAALFLGALSDLIRRHVVRHAVVLEHLAVAQRHLHVSRHGLSSSSSRCAVCRACSERRVQQRLSQSLAPRRIRRS